MNKIDELLEYIHKTNPGMTRERLLEELSAQAHTQAKQFCLRWNLLKIVKQNFKPPWV